MEQNKIWTLVGVLAIGVGLAGVIIGLGMQADSPGSAPYATKSAGAYTESDVQLELTPQGFENGTLVVSFVANTHGVDLSEAFSKAPLLVYDDAMVEATTVVPPSGHHGSGTMVFPVDAKPERFSITVYGPGPEQEREFRWP